MCTIVLRYIAKCLTREGLLLVLSHCDGDGEEGLGVERNTGGSAVVCYLVLLVESPELRKTA